MPSASPISVSVRPARSMSRCQSALLRASRETSRPSTRPTRASATSAVSRAKPDRATAPAPERPRSSSMTTIRSSGQPSSRALLTSAYCRSVDSRLFSTWAGLDWRKYTIAWRERWFTVILARSFIGHLLALLRGERVGDEASEELERGYPRSPVDLLPRRRVCWCRRARRRRIRQLEKCEVQLHGFPYAAPTQRVG